MVRRIPPHLWPALALASPALAPWLALRSRRYGKARVRAGQVNRARLAAARPLELPVLESLEITVLVEEAREPGFGRDPGVSYLLRSERGAMLFDVGFGPGTDTLARNASRIGFDLSEVDGLVISHLHLDHMGGREAARAGAVALPTALGDPSGMPCFLPELAEAPGFSVEVVDGPRLLPGGLATTGPLGRALFLLGPVEEQSLVARLAGKGLVVVTGCGHPRIEVILAMVRRLSDQPLHALVGGLHFPVTASRLRAHGVELQMLLGTGKPPWQRITDEDLSRAIATITEAAPERVLLSSHDSCDHAIDRLGTELPARVELLRAGGRYLL